MSTETTKVDDGGPAFPQPETKNGNTVADEHGQGGMTLRDYFAGQALAGLLSDPNVAQGSENWARSPGKFAMEVAESAYAFADAMLAAKGGR